MKINYVWRSGALCKILCILTVATALLFTPIVVSQPYGSLTEDALGHLTTQLANESQYLQIDAAYSLARLGHKRGLAHLFSIAADSWNDRDVRQLAIWIIGELEQDTTHADTVNELVSIYDNAKNYSNNYLRLQAVTTIGRIGGDEALLALLEPFRSDPFDSVRNWAAYYLGEIGGEPAVNALREQLSRESKLEIQLVIAGALVKLSQPEGVNFLIEHVLEESSHSLEIQVAALRELARNLNINSRSLAEPFLERLLASDQPIELRIEAAVGLSQLDQQLGIDFIAEATSSPDPSSRYLAAQALSQLKGGGSERLLLELLKDDVSYVNEEAAFSLARVGGANSAIALGNYLLTEGRPESAYRTAINSLMAIGSPSGLPYLLEAIRSDEFHWLLKSNIIRAIGLLPTSGDLELEERRESVLLSLLTHDLDPLVNAAIIALGELQICRGLPELEQEFYEPDADTGLLNATATAIVRIESRCTSPSGGHTTAHLSQVAH